MKAIWEKFAKSPTSLSFHTKNENLNWNQSQTVLASLERLKKLTFSDDLKNRFLIPPALKGTEDPLWLERWYYSRVCVIEALDEAIQKGLEPKNILLSLSHSPGASIAICAEGREGLGVDVESSSRVISDKLAQKFILDVESKYLRSPYGLNPLQLWVIKEACYKAYPENKGTVIPHYRIAMMMSPTEQGVTLKTEGVVEIASTVIKFLLVSNREWSIAFAII